MKRPLNRIFDDVPVNGRLLDVGCMGFVQIATAARNGRTDLQHFGVDFVDPDGELPAGFTFVKADLAKEPLPFDDDFFDVVVASHVIEHLEDPVGLIRECVRVCSPGGIIYLEAPSERSAMMPSMPFHWDRFHSLSFYDDPTHISRPWTPQAFFRLARLLGCDPVDTRHIVSWPHRLLAPILIPLALILRDARNLEYWSWLIIGWSCCIVMRKPGDLHGSAKLGYFVPEGR